MLRPATLALTLALAVGVPSVAVAAAPGVQLREPAARAEFRRALEAWEREDYAVAAEALDLTYALEPHPDLLYARAQARRMLGHCRDALVLFEAYLATNPSESDKVRDTHINIERCRAQLEVPKTADTSTPSPEPNPGTEDSAPGALPASLDRPWHRDPLGGTLVGVGAAGLVTGGILWQSTLWADERALRAGTYGEFRRAHTSAERRMLAATLVTVGGSALLVGGLLRWAVEAARARRTSAR